MIKCVFLLILFYVIGAIATIYKLDDAQYEQMPPVVTLDPYRSCLRPPGGLYCSGYVTFVADEPTPLLTMMQEYSAHTASHYNHMRAFFGTCISKKCKDFYDDKNDTTLDLNSALEACLNHYVGENYNLRVKADGNFTCIKHNENIPYKAQMVDIIVAAVVIALIILNVIGSLFDIHCPVQHKWTGVKLLLCFSIPRNWQKLMAPPRSDAGCFRALYGIRAILITLVVVVHSMLPIIIACADTKFIEDNYDNPLLHLLLNGPVAMQTFFFISAMLMVFNMQMYAENNSINWFKIPIFFVRRWLRLTPSYAIVLALTATWLRVASSGPFWHELVIKESLDCRRDWWLHLLYINNYVDYSKCMPQTWYVATDTQLYSLGIIVYMLGRNLTIRKVLLPSLVLIGMALPGLQTYFQDLDGSLIVSPAAVIEFFNADKTFNEIYKRGHTNMCSFIIGMTCGYLIYHVQKNNYNLNMLKKWRAVYWCLLPMVASIIIPCKVFYEEGPRVHMAYRVLLAATMKPIFTILVAAFIVGAIFKLEDYCRGVLEWRGWTVPGRLSYSVYLLHVPLIRVTCGTLTEPVWGSYWLVFQSTQCIVMTTFLAACVFWVTVEAPLANLLRWDLATSTSEKDQLKMGENIEENQTKL